ncbi:MAG: stalk domain-containing protein [Peptostreptococcaceae bacterium]|nr:stalk domain-containing protein [Peptostreptococcaceae bacterium]
MNRLKKVMALGAMSAMLVTSVSFAEMQAQDGGIVSGTGVLPSNSSDMIVGQELGPWAGKIVSFRGNQEIKKSDFQGDPQTQRGDKEYPVYLKIVNVVRNRKDGVVVPIRPDQFGLSENCTLELYEGLSFDKKIDADENIDVPDALLPIYAKVIEERDGIQNSEFFFVIKLYFENAPSIDPIFNTPPQLLDDLDQGGKRNLKIQVTLNDANDKSTIQKQDIKAKDSSKIEFYGKDREFRTSTEEAVTLDEKASTSVFFTVEKGNHKYYYELQVKRTAQPKKQDQDPPQKQDPPAPKKDQVPKQDPKKDRSAGGGGSSHSSVRPDSAPADKKPDAKTDIKKTDDKKSEMKDMSKTSDSKVSTKLMIGEKKYTVVIDGASMEKTADVAPMVHMGRTVLPARMISEVLGVEVKFDATTKTASFMYGENNKVELTLGQKYMMVNGEKIELTADILNKDGRILLPLTDIQKAFAKLGLKANIEWDAATKSVNIEK